MFKIFPATLTHDSPPRKVPLIKGWREKASSDPNQHALWVELFKGKLKFWAIPTGPENGILVLDLDVKHKAFEHVQRLGLELPPTLSQRTMSGGAHLFYRYPTDGKHYGNRANMFGTKEAPTGIDIRGEGGYVFHYALDKTPIADAPAWMLAEATVKATEKPAGPLVLYSPEVAEQMIQDALQAIVDAPPGEANNTLNKESYRIGQLVASSTISREYAFDQLYRVATERGQGAYEAKATITSGIDGGMKNPHTSPFGEIPPPQMGSPTPVGHTEPVAEKPWLPRIFTRAELMDRSKLKKPQHFEHWSTEDIHIVTADGGTGKTTLEMYESVCMALGQPFLGFDCKKPGGKTLFITGEDTEEKLGAMMGQIMIQMGITNSPEIEEHVRHSIAVKKDPDFCLISKDRATGFLVPNRDAMRKLEQAIQWFRPSKVVFDPLASFWGSENAVNDMSKAVGKFFGEIVEKYSCQVVGINHMGKSSSQSDDMSQFAGRGGTGLPSHARVSRALKAVYSEEYQNLTGKELTESQSAMRCNVNKFTDGSPLFMKPFLIVRDGYVFRRESILEHKQVEEDKKLSDIERVFTFVKGERNADRYPTLKVIIGHFASCGDPMSKERVNNAISMISYQGHMGEKFATVVNPDLSVKDRVYVVTDMEGKEL